MKKSKIVVTKMDKIIFDLAIKSDHKTLAIWAIDCALRVLPYFEDKFPKDIRPKKAIETLQEWIKTGIFKMAVIRKASLGAHAAARLVEKDYEACSVARACGQAVATAHVSTHSVAAAMYAATAVRDKNGSTDEATKEREWQYQHLLELSKI